MGINIFAGTKEWGIMKQRNTWKETKAFSSNVSASSIIPGLSLIMRIQNSVSLRKPFPLRSPSFTMASASSIVIPSNPKNAEFLLRLSDVINPVNGSASNLKPEHSSDMKVRESNFSAITGVSGEASRIAHQISHCRDLIQVLLCFSVFIETI